MPVVSPFVVQLNDSYWDLMKVTRWNEPSPQTVPPTLQVFFIDTAARYVVFDKVDFEVAMQNALDSL